MFRFRFFRCYIIRSSCNIIPTFKYINAGGSWYFSFIHSFVRSFVRSFNSGNNAHRNMKNSVYSDAESNKDTSLYFDSDKKADLLLEVVVYY